MDIILTQGKDKKSASVILSVTRSGISSTINDIAQAVENMRYILEDDEWKKLSKAKDVEKESLFLEYWESRDPTPETSENEVMDEYFSRVNYSNGNFKSYLPGWKTDMGMIYILFGPPDEIQRTNPSTSTASLYQVWSYYKISKQFVFRDQNGFGDYRLDTPFLGAGL